MHAVEKVVASDELLRIHLMHAVKKVAASDMSY